MEFDPEYCGAEDEETHLRTLRREVDSLKEPEGRAVISTPCLDPDEKDPKQRARLAKMNKVDCFNISSTRNITMSRCLTNIA